MKRGTIMGLEEYRVYKGYTYDVLSDLSGLARSKVYRICKGKCCPRIHEAYALIKATKGFVRMEDLLPEDCA